MLQPPRVHWIHLPSRVYMSQHSLLGCLNCETNNRQRTMAQIQPAECSSLSPDMYVGENKLASNDMIAPPPCGNGKRKADDDLQPPRQQRASPNDGQSISCDVETPFQLPPTTCIATEGDVATSTPSPTPQSFPSLSLNDQIRNQQERLWVHPLQWTLYHLDVLNCDFVDRSETSQPLVEESNTKSAVKAGLQPERVAVVSSNIEGALNLLSLNFKDIRSRKLAVSNLIIACGFNFREAEDPTNDNLLLFTYGKQHVASLRVDCAFSHPSTSVAYLDLEHVKYSRTNTVYTTWHQRLLEKWPVNMPVRRILDDKLRRIEPLAQQHDPFILATLVALAQERRRALLKRYDTKELSATAKSGQSTRQSRQAEDAKTSSVQVSWAFSDAASFD